MYEFCSWFMPDDALWIYFFYRQITADNRVFGKRQTRERAK